MRFTVAEGEAIVAKLEAMPRRLAGMTAGAVESRLRTAPGRKSWAAADILAHLRACADLWGNSIYAMLAATDVELPDIDERKWARAARYAEVTFKESLQAYTLQRNNLVRVLRGLTPAAWERSALIFGRRHTVFSQARRMAKHEQEHSGQIESLLQ
ncbi:MAG: DinB family protein [Anaerolineae bacterium]